MAWPLGTEAIWQFDSSVRIVGHQAWARTANISRHVSCSILEEVKWFSCAHGNGTATYYAQDTLI